MNSSTPSDQPALPGLVLASQSDFCRFYDVYAPRLYGHLLRQGYSVATAQSLLEETFCQCWHQRDQRQTDHPSLIGHHPLTWLLHVAQKQAFLRRLEYTHPP